MPKLFLLFLLLVFSAICSAFGFAFADTMNMGFIIPCLIGVAGIITVIVLMVRGRKEVSIRDDKLIIKRGNKVFLCVAKSDLHSVSFVFDLFEKSLYMISFKQKNKKYYIEITDENKNDLIAFFDSIEKNCTNNLIYYLIDLFVI